MSNYFEDVYTGKTLPEVALTWSEPGTIDASAVTRGRSANVIMRQAIIQATNNSTLSPQIYKEILRSLRHVFGNIHYSDGKGARQRVDAIHAYPERVIGTLTQEENIVLPIISIALLSEGADDKRRRFEPVLIQKKRWNDDKQRAERIISFADLPINLGYTINVWAKYMDDLDQLSQSIIIKFNPSLELKTSFSETTTAFLESATDNSTVITADREDRLLRRAFEIEIQTYIPSPKFKVTSTGRIESIFTEAWIIN